MKTEQQIRNEMIKTMNDIEDAERCIKGEYGNEIFQTFSEYRSAKTKLSTLKWVLSDKKK